MENKLSIEEQVSNRVTGWLAGKVILSEIEHAKISYGISFMLISFVKISLIYLVSMILGTLSATTLTHIPFFIIRGYSRGFHAKSSFNCGATGVVCFSFLPWLIRVSGLGLKDIDVIIIAIICTAILYFRAPANTLKNQIVDKKQRNIVKLKALVINTILFGIIFVSLGYTERLIASSGLIIASILTLPLEKILWRNEK